MAAWIWVLIAIAAAIVVIVLLALGARRRRSGMLRQRFGPEYERTVEERADRRAAEADLRYRERRRAQFDIKPLPEDSRLRFAGEWRQVQERFVDHPAQAVAAADGLVAQVMRARGYPTKDFEAQADLVSVDHPAVVGNYRAAHAVADRSQRGQASTEDLREALLRYRSLFDELLRPDGAGTRAASTGPVEGAATATPDETGPATSDAAGRETPDTAGPETSDEAGRAAGDAEYEREPMRRGGQ